MKYLFVLFLFYVFLLLNKINGAKTKIKILTNMPDVPSVCNENWETTYSNFMNAVFSNINTNDDILKNYEITYSFYDKYDKNGISKNYWLFLVYIIKSFQNGDYDLLILDDRLLYSNHNSLMKSDFLFYYFDILDSIDTIFLDLSDYIKDEDLNYHDPKILNDGKYKNRIYGLPYEMDFNLLYYKNNDEITKKNLENIEDVTWDDLWRKLKPSGDLDLALDDENSFFDFFLEYTHNYYNATKEYDKNYYKLFYNETSELLYKNFLNLIRDYSGVDENIIPKQNQYYYNDSKNKTFYDYSPFLSYDKSCNDFLEGKKYLYRGRASHKYIFDKYNTDVGMSLQPKHLSAVIEKYLVVNKNSKIDKKILSKVALQLTSKNMQLIRAQEFDSVPTFDLNKKDKYSEIAYYCHLFPELCSIMEKMKRLDLKDMFKYKYSMALVDIMTNFYVNMKKYLFLFEHINDVASIYYNAFELITSKLGIYEVFTYIFEILFTIISCITMIMVHKYKKHPYLRVISPEFCNMIVFGCTLNILLYLQYLPPYSTFKARFFYVFESVSTGFIHIPMFAITYRIYSIYQTKSLNDSFLNNKKVLCIIIILISIPVLYRLIIMLIFDVVYCPLGDIYEIRFPESLLKSPIVIYENLYSYYFFGIVSCIHNINIFIIIIYFKLIINLLLVFYVALYDNKNRRKIKKIY